MYGYRCIRVPKREYRAMYAAIRNIAILSILLLLPLPAHSIKLMSAARPATALQQAQQAYSDGDEATALSTLRRYIINHPDSCASACTMMARIMLDKQQYDDALFYLQRIPESQLDSSGKLLLAAALHHSGNSKDADDLIDTIDSNKLNNADKLCLLVLRAARKQDARKPLQALALLNSAARQADRDYRDQVIFPSMVRTVSTMSGEQLAEAEFMFASGAVHDTLQLRRAQLALHLGNNQQARHIATELLGTVDNNAIADAAAKILDQIVGDNWQQQAIGVVLPLSGRYSPFGKRIKQGIELAARQNSAAIRFIFVDNMSDPAQTEAAMRNLIYTRRVLAIIGPLSSNNCRRAAIIAEGAHVPMIALAPHADIPQLGDYVLRNSLTSAQQAYALASYAINELGLNTYAIMAPDSRSGHEFSRLFSAAITAAGGDIVRRQFFPTDATDFRHQLLLLKGENPDAPPEEDKQAGEEQLAVEQQREAGLPSVDFEALFIPAYADKVAMLAPQLEFYGIENVQLLGINGWNSPRLLKQAGRYINHAIFTDGFFTAGDNNAVSAFVSACAAQFKQQPSILEAQGYDSACFVQRAIATYQPTTAADMQRALLQLRGFDGVSGLRSFEHNGEARRDIAILQVRRHAIRQIASEPGSAPDTSSDSSILSGATLRYAQ